MKVYLVSIFIVVLQSCSVKSSMHSIYIDDELEFFKPNIIYSTDAFFRQKDIIFSNSINQTAFFDNLFQEIEKSNLFLNYEITVKDKQRESFLYQKKYEKIKIDDNKEFIQLAKTSGGGNWKFKLLSSTFFGCTFHQNFSKKEGNIIVYDILYHNRFNVILKVLCENGKPL